MTRPAAAREIHVQVRTPQESLTSKSPSPASNNAQHYVCSFCPASFRRDEHLQRHIRTHTGEKKYRCPCKMTFARNDVFVRHMRTCQPGLAEKIRGSDRKVRSFHKTKRACDECAKAKAKCNYRVPCERCHRKSITCEKTRKGYEDPYAIYSIVSPVTTPPTTAEVATGNLTQIELQEAVERDSADELILGSGVGLGSLVGIPPVDPALEMSDTLCIPEHEVGLSQNLSDGEQNGSALMLPPSPQTTQMRDDNSPIFMDHTGILTEYDVSAGNDCGVGTYTDPVSLHLASMGNLDLLLNPQSQYQAQSIEGYDFFSFQQMATPLNTDNFSLHKLDPLRGKCEEIIDVLKRADAHDAEQAIYSYITRDNMVYLCHLYGKHFQQNMSIIHAPTFAIWNSPPTLILAIMLVGACYSPDTIPASQVAKLARKLVTTMALEPYETEMSCPSIAHIQAGVLILCILTCSKDTAALRSVRLCAARNISMCERAGLLDPVEPIDYSSLTVETFDWHLWIQQESGKRLACEIFCQDMVHCIFLGRTPDFDPCHFQVELPSYEDCWRAETAAECLHALQNLPRPMRVATALTKLLSWPDADVPLFEASNFGMFVLMSGMHFLLHQATQADKETMRHMLVMTDFDSEHAIKQLNEYPSGPNITAIADRTVKIHASPAIGRVDNALNAWRTTWDLRRNQGSQNEQPTFKGDPLPFWWLAKLYLLLHYHGHIVQPGTEYSSPRPDAPDDDAKTAIQRKVVGWLSSFRGKSVKLGAETENWLPELMKLAH